jgi:gluconolactonase
VRLGENLRVVASGLDHPEGVCWSPDEQVVYAGGEAGQLYRFPLSGGVPQTAAVVPHGELLGLAIGGPGVIYACDPGNHHVQRIAAGQAQPFGDRIGYPNYPVFDADGVLWVSDSGAWEEATGSLVRILPNGETERVATRPIRFANGLAISGDFLYLVESGSDSPGVSRYPLGGGELETVIDLPETVPDGLAFDAEGGLWISCCQPNRVYRMAPDRTLETIVDDWSGEWVVSPTNVAFAGEGLDELVLASLFGHAVKAITPGVKGMPLVSPEPGQAATPT